MVEKNCHNGCVHADLEKELEEPFDCFCNKDNEPVAGVYACPGYEREEDQEEY